MALTLPDVTDLATDVLRAATLPTGTLVVTRLPADWVKRMPLVVTSVVTGGNPGVGPGSDTRFAAWSNLQVECLAADRPAAQALSTACWDALRDAWLKARRFDHGVIARVLVQARPALMPASDPSGTAHFHATYRLLVRP